MSIKTPSPTMKDFRIHSERMLRRAESDAVNPLSEKEVAALESSIQSVEDAFESYGGGDEDQTLEYLSKHINKTQIAPKQVEAEHQHSKSNIAEALGLGLGIVSVPTTILALAASSLTVATMGVGGIAAALVLAVACSRSEDKASKLNSEVKSLQDHSYSIESWNVFTPSAGSNGNSTHLEA